MQVPLGIVLHTVSRTLEITWESGRSDRLPFEYLRVESPSAEVTGHREGEEQLQVGKRDVRVVGVEPVGNYAVKLVFDDGHDTGLYSWEYLWDLCVEREARWKAYLDRLADAGASRDPNDPANAAFAPKPKPQCPSHAKGR